MNRKLILAFIVLSSHGLMRSEAQQPAVRFAKPDQQERFERLSGLGSCVVDWHCRVAGASDDDKKDLTAVMHGLAVTLAKRHSWRSGDLTPATFAGSRGKPGRVLVDGRPWERTPSGWEKAVTSTLKADQLTKLKAAMGERQDFLVRNIVNAHLGYIEGFVGLTKGERKTLRERLTKEHARQLLLRPLCVENLKELHLLDDDVIRRTLATRAKRLSQILLGRRLDGATPVSATVDVPKKWSEEKRDEEISKVLEGALARVARVHDTRIQAVVDQYKLGEKSRRRLQLAAKGVRARLSKGWRGSLSERVKATEQRFAEMVETLVVDATGIESLTASERFVMESLDRSKLWQKTLEAVLEGKGVVSATDLEFLRQGAVSQLLVAFDNELWLRPDQRESFRERLDKTVDVFRPRALESHVTGLISKTARRLEKDVETILSPAQVRVFRQLR